jgi:NAD-dependent dihydropyrimidine dehydrogenase PreA subunit
MKTYIGPKSLNYKKQVEKALKKKSISTLKSELQKIFNTYIRLRDTQYDKGQAFFVCISCGEKKTTDQMHAGHYWPVGGNEAVRFDEDNCHGQCIACNYHKHGNEKGYRPRLIKKIGQSRFDMLEIKRLNRSKMMAFELEYLIEDYKTKVNGLTKKQSV